MSSFTDLSTLAPTSRVTKTRSKAAMKPILKKASHSEKNSLDLDRGWEDAIHYGNHGWGNSGKKSSDSFAGRVSAAGGLGLYEGRSKDVSFTLSATDLNNGPASSAYGTRKYSHTRSASGTSHVSVATSGSGARGGTFIHPFQQTPRSSTPPLSYANSLASVDAGTHVRDYSPTITEGDDDVEMEGGQLRNYHTTPYAQAHPSSLRRSSLASQRTSSQTDLNTAGQLRVNTVRANTAPTTRLRGSRSDLRLDRLTTDSPVSSTAPAQAHTLVTSPTSPSVAPSLSPLRSSLEMNFRLRSRSEVDTAARQAQIREARRQFEDKEATKQAARDEKAARRRDAEAVKRERRARRSGVGEGRPEVGRRDTGGSTTAAGAGAEKEFVAWGYEDAVGGARPEGRGAEEEEEEEEGGRKVSTRRRTASVWTSFILWVRTKLLKAGRR